jgi:hypothetical protein
LPIQVFGPVWRKWIEQVANSKSAPADYIVIGLLVAASGLVGNARRIMPWSGWIEPIHCWGASVGLPSSGKSPSADAVRDPVRELEAEAASGYAEKLREWETSRMAAKARKAEWEEKVKEATKQKKQPPTLPADAVEPPRPARPRILIGDTTPEAVAATLSATPKGLILYRDELAGWIGGFDRYSRGSGERGF